MATSPRCPKKLQQQKRRKNEATEQHGRPAGTESEKPLHLDRGRTAEQPIPRERSDRVSEYRSTPPLPDIAVGERHMQTLEQDGNGLPLEMEVESDYELSSPTLTQQRMARFTISDDSATA